MLGQRSQAACSTGEEQYICRFNALREDMFQHLLKIHITLLWCTSCLKLTYGGAHANADTLRVECGAAGYRVRSAFAGLCLGVVYHAGNSGIGSVNCNASGAQHWNLTLNDPSASSSGTFTSFNFYTWPTEHDVR